MRIISKSFEVSARKVTQRTSIQVILFPRDILTPLSEIVLSLFAIFATKALPHQLILSVKTAQ